MIGDLPTAFAVAGTALMSVAIFAPFRKRIERADDRPQTQAESHAETSPNMQTQSRAQTPPKTQTQSHAETASERDAPAPNEANAATQAEKRVEASSVEWPALVDESATACDGNARIDLAEALGALQSPWAETILRQAVETETDPAVRVAISSALSSSQSLVT